LELEQLASLLALQGVAWINLQHGNVAAEIESTGMRIHDWPEFDLYDDLENLAARIAACDLVISVGNAAVHLAGALGVPTWCLLPAVGAWRWGPMERSTPWYASVRPLYQAAAGNWKSLLDSISVVLPEWFIAHSQSSPARSWATLQSLKTDAAPQPLPAKAKAPLAIPHWLATPAASSQDLLH